MEFWRKFYSKLRKWEIKMIYVWWEWFYSVYWQTPVWHHWHKAQCNVWCAKWARCQSESVKIAEIFPSCDLAGAVSVSWTSRRVGSLHNQCRKASYLFSGIHKLTLVHRVIDFFCAKRSFDHPASRGFFSWVYLHHLTTDHLQAWTPTGKDSPWEISLVLIRKYFWWLWLVKGVSFRFFWVRDRACDRYVAVSV